MYIDEKMKEGKQNIFIIRKNKINLYLYILTFLQF